MATAILRTDFGNFLEKNLTTVFVSAMKGGLGPHEWKGVFEVRKADMEEEKIQHYPTFGRAPELGEAEPIIMDTSSEGYVYPFKIKKFGLGFSISQEMIEDNQYAKITPVFTRGLAKSMKDTKELEAANILNFGFSTDQVNLLPDGKPLFSKEHDTFGGNQSNVLETAAEFSELTLEQMKIMLIYMKDDRGLDVYLNWKCLVHPPELRYDITRVLKSDLRSGTDKNDLNAMMSLDGTLKTVQMKKLTHPGRVYLQTDELNGAICFEKRPYRTKMYSDFLTETRQFKATARYKFGVGSWRAFISNGAV